MTEVEQKSQKPYYVYILRCQDDSLYTGITTDLDRRFAEHQSKGSKYTASRKPLRYETAFTVPNRSNALKLELKIKSLSRKGKEDIISGKKSLSGVYNSKQINLS